MCCRMICIHKTLLLDTNFSSRWFFFCLSVNFLTKDKASPLTFHPSTFSYILMVPEHVEVNVISVINTALLCPWIFLYSKKSIGTIWNIFGPVAFYGALKHFSLKSSLSPPLPFSRCSENAGFLNWQAREIEGTSV